MQVTCRAHLYLLPCTVLYIPTYTYAYMNTHMHTPHIYLLPHTCTCIHTCTYLGWWERGDTHTHTHTHTHRDQPTLESAHLNLLVYIHDQTVQQHSMLCHCSRGQNRAVDQPLHVHLSRGLLHPNHTHVYTRVTPVLLFTYKCTIHGTLVHHPCYMSMLHPRYHMCYIGASQTHYPMYMCGHVRYMYMHALILHTPRTEFKMTSSLFFGGNPCIFRNPTIL